MQALAQVVGAKPDADDDVARDGDVDVEWRHALLRRTTRQVSSWHEVTRLTTRPAVNALVQRTTEEAFQQGVTLTYG